MQSLAAALVGLAIGQSSYLEEDGEAQCLSARRALRSGQIVFTVEYGEGVPKQKFEFAFDGELRRMDRYETSFAAAAAGGSEPPVYTRIDKNIVTPTEHIRHLSDLDYGGTRFIASVSRLEDVASETENLHGRETQLMHRAAVFDPRLLGMTPQSFGHYWLLNLGTFFRSDLRTESKVSEELLNGRRVWKHTFTWPGGARCTEWLSPEQQWQPLRLQLVFGDGPDECTDEMSAELEEFPAGDATTWFPRRVTIRRSTATGKERTTTIRVESATFNRPIPAETFTLADFKLPPGNLVRVRKSQPFKPGSDSVEIPFDEWDGEKLVPLSQEAAARHRVPTETQPATPKETRPLPWNLTVPLNLIFWGGAIIWLVRRK